MKSFVRMLFAVAISVASPALGGQKAGTETEDMQALTILARNCAGCHQEADHPGALFLNQARLTEADTIKLITKLVETSQMPPAHAGFKKTRDGKTLLKWLKKQAKQK